MQEEIRLSLTMEELNKVIDALGQKPFVEVYKLIEKLHTQATAQIEESEDVDHR
ncbi:hypothetical protein FUAX_46100 (plasmid) [Fulvitalea axinellae]|uniref:Uncharacterized protein n=1 Tax=Fulvitalea axinellae TaxID=1182444 RepID=A0AAU9CPK3_9BACT|nr:hypothetical protein FUAX_46100 [Fulvitalea axinellae]